MKINFHKKARLFLVSNRDLFDVIKNITEIVALIIAATWAVYNFQVKESPILEKSAKSFCELKIDSMSEKKNILKYVLHLKNTGVTSFDVDSVIIKYWLIPVDTMMRDKYFSAMDYVDQTSPDYSMIDDGFSYHYGPDKECIERYLFFIDKKPDCGILIKSVFFMQGKIGFTTEHFIDDTYSFKIHCVPGTTE
jgi:hypothetical protein